jgi:glutathione S-transferase
MQLIGMLDSPYVRRVAITLQLLGLPFEHRSVSVFRDFDAFYAINPVVKAPTLVCDDGTVLLDSTLIIDYAEGLARVAGQRSLVPADAHLQQADLRVTGLALAACEKSVQIVYERGLRPPEKHHEPWITRVTGQLLAALAALEEEVSRRPPVVATTQLTQAGVTTAVTWYFVQAMLPHVVPAPQFPTLMAFSARAETLAPFRAAPHGDGIYR